MDEVESHRREDCVDYENCLDQASAAGWKSFTCASCTAYWPDLNQVSADLQLGLDPTEGTSRSSPTVRKAERPPTHDRKPSSKKGAPKSPRSR